MDALCTLKRCLLRMYRVAIPEERQNQEQPYPFKVYGIYCDMDCDKRKKWRGVNYDVDRRSGD